MYRLVVFDLDGTLADTLADLAKAVNSALRAYDLPTHSVEKYNKFVGNGITNLIKQVLMDKADDDELNLKIKEYFDMYYPKHLCDNTKAYEGMAQVLKKLSKAGIKTAVHSNKPHQYVPQILQTLYSDHKFDVVLGHKPCYMRKPDPQALFAIMETVLVNSDEVIYVGDSDVDVMTAHNAGIKVCGVQWGFRGKSELEAAGADFIVKDADELLEVLMG